MPRPIRIGTLLTLGLLLAVMPTAVFAVPGQAFVGGVVIDSTGSPLGEVELLLGRAGEHVRSERSDAEGRYLFHGVPPGSYLLLATKVGYRATLAQVNTLTDGPKDLTLRILGETRPAGSPAPATPENEAWALRLPARDVLRDVGTPDVLNPGALEAAGRGGGTTPAEWSQRFNAEVQQWFSMALGTTSAEGNPLDEGRATAFEVGGLSEGVGWSVNGDSARTAAAFEEGALRQVDDESHRLLVNVNVNPDIDNRVDISAWFDQADRVYDPGMEQGIGAGQRKRAWGYGARWSGRVSPTSDVDVQLGYGVASLDALRSQTYLAAGGNALEDEYWSAVGAVTLRPGEGHQIRLGMRASFQEHGSEDLRLAMDPAFTGPGGPVGVGRRGWSVNVFGKESYEILGPLALEVGLDLHHLGFEQPISYILPQAGVTYRPGKHDTVRAVVMAKFADGGVALTEVGPASDTAQLGYLLAWDRQLGADVMISIAVALRPYAQERLIADEFVAFDPATRQPLFLSDGSATSREVSLRLERRFGGFHASGGLRYGEVRGSLVSSLPNALPSQMLAYDEVRFVSTSLRTFYVPWGTRVAVDFQRVQNESLALNEGYAAPLTYSSLDVVLQQRISRHSGRGDWSLLVGYQTLLNVSEQEGGEQELARLGIPAELKQVRGGVSVRF